MLRLMRDINIFVYLGFLRYGFATFKYFFLLKTKTQLTIFSSKDPKIGIAD